MNEHQETAPQLKKTEPPELKKVIAYFATFFVMGLVVNSLGPALPALANNTGTDLDSISIIFTAFSLGLLIISLSGGILYDRLPGNPVLAAALILMTAMTIITPISKNLVLLSAAWILIGIAKGAGDTGGNTLIVWLFKAKSGMYLNAIHFFFGAGSFLAPIIVTRITLATGSITWAYWVLAALILPVIVYLLLSPNTDSRPTTTKQATKTAIHWPLVIMIGLFFFFYIGIELSFSGWIFTYAQAMNLSNVTAAAYLTSAFWGSLTLSRLLFIPLTTRLKPAAILFGALTGCIISIGSILIWQHSQFIIWAGTIGMGISMSSILPMTIALAGRRMDISGQITGFLFAGGSLGGMSLPWIIGQLFNVMGPQITMISILTSLLFAFIILLIITARYKARTQTL